MIEFFQKLFDTSDYPARWYCGNWSAGEGWLHIISDVATFGAYVAIPCILIWFVRKRQDTVFPKVFWLFAAFIFACGSVHLTEAVIFWHPVYRFSGLMKCFTAIASWATVIAVVRIAPDALRLPSLMALNEQLQTEVNERKKVEERLNSILNSMSDGVMVSDPEGNLEFLNPAAQRVLRLEESERSWKERFSRYSLYEAGRMTKLNYAELPLQRAGTGEQVSDMELSVRCPSKQVDVTVEISANPVTDPSGEICGAVAVFHDTTDLKRERSTRIETEARLAAIVDSMSDGIVVANAEGELEMFNPAAEKIIGIGRTDSQSDEWSAAYGLYDPETGELCPPDELPLVQALTGAPRVEKELIVRNDNLMEDVRIAARATPIHDAAGRITGAVAVFHDITETRQIERERAQKEIRDQVERIERANTLGELTAGIAHELNQPLTAIVNFTDEAHSLTSENLSEQSIAELSALTRKAYEQAVRAGDILRSIRSFIRQQPGRVMEFDVLDLIHETIELMADQIKNIDVRVNSDSESDAIVLEADRTQVQQVLINLIRNAITAVADCDRKEITLIPFQSGDAVSVELSDTGIGIENSKVDRLFDAFYSGTTGGLGLGLKICRTIAELHGGHIDVAGAENRGATLTVTLPKRKTKPEPEA